MLHWKHLNILAFEHGSCTNKQHTPTLNKYIVIYHVTNCTNYRRRSSLMRMRIRFKIQHLGDIRTANGNMTRDILSSRRFACVPNKNEHIHANKNLKGETNYV